jgi:TonB family protein
MRKHHSISQFSTLVAVLLACSAVAATQRLNEPGITPGTRARLVESTVPEYPPNELRRQREGWVRLSYVVTNEGAVVDPIIEDSSGSREFERSALSAVRKLLYNPATWNGEPVEQCFTSTMVTFSTGDADITMSGAFNRRYREINRLLASHDLEAAQQLIDDAFRNFRLNVADLARLWMLRGTYAQAVGDDELQLGSFRKAVANGGKWISDGVYRRLMTSIISLELSAGDYSSALGNYAALVEKNGDGAIPSSMQRAFVRVRKQIDTAEILAVPARLTADRQCDDCPADWQYETLRRKLSISKIRGSLDNIEIRCEWQRVVHEARSDVTWTLPEEWGKCRIIVSGDKGTTFDLHEIEPALQD